MNASALAINHLEKVIVIGLFLVCVGGSMGR